MPLWRIFHHPSAFTAEQKQALAADITKLYTSPPVSLPAFYVNVLFVALEEDQLFIGGAARRDFVRIAIEQIARTMPDADSATGAAHRAAWMDRINEVRGCGCAAV
jgi:phenylpyruvate tautomerase PptA (4-oxalocrotonate tautomerase family)